MADRISPKARSINMSRIRSVRTEPELIVRRAIKAIGFSARYNVVALPGKPDIAIPKTKMAVFVHGCFWHKHGCSRSVMPKSNVGYWEPKILNNVKRFKRDRKKLNRLGWHVRVFWECRLRKCDNLLAYIKQRLVLR